MTQISAHRILAELKVIGDRIDTAAREQFVSYYVGDDGVPNGYKSIQEFEDRAKAKWDSVNALIKRRDVLKAALIASNAVATVKVAGVEMTVAEAIDRKDSINHKKQLFNNLRGQYGNVVNRIEGERRILDQKIDKRIEDAAGGKDKKGNLSVEETEDIVKMTKKRYEPHFVDPIKAVDQIDSLLKEIQDFELEVDTALSESNARTMIEIPE